MAVADDNNSSCSSLASDQKENREPNCGVKADHQGLTLQVLYISWMHFDSEVH